MHIQYTKVNLSFVQLLAKHISLKLKQSDSISLSGDLGAGKTTFARFLILSFLPSETVVSPTFNIVNTYSYKDFCIYHFDLYRLKSTAELYEIGIDNLLNHGISIVEWSELLKNIVNFSLEITISYTNQENVRNITISCYNQCWYNYIRKLTH